MACSEKVPIAGDALNSSSCQKIYELLRSDRSVHSIVFHLLAEDVTLTENCRISSLPASALEPVVRPRQHIIFADTSSESGGEVQPPPQPKARRHIVFDTSDSDSNVGQTAGEPVTAKQSGDDDDSGDNSRQGDRASRSAYVGRGNVQAVRAARKQAGLSDGFPRSDPLLMEFARFMRTSGAAEKDISNKVILYWLSLMLKMMGLAIRELVL